MKQLPYFLMKDLLPYNKVIKNLRIPIIGLYNTIIQNFHAAKFFILLLLCYDVASQYFNRYHFINLIASFLNRFAMVWRQNKKMYNYSRPSIHRTS